MSIVARMACAAAMAACVSFAQTAPAAGEWISMFDGKTLSGWKVTPFKGAGEVKVDDGIIRLGKGRTTGITWAGDFPTSGYEIRFEAARLEGKDFFAAITFPVQDSHCTWINGGWDGTVVGLSNLDGNDATENDTSTMREFVQGQWYAFRLVVTQDRIRGWIDGAVIINVDISGRKVELRFDDTYLSAPLGFSSYATVGGLRKVQYRTLAGAGK